MSDESYTFEQTRIRLEEILVQVKRKDTSLEQSLELLEEGVRLANLSNELIDQTSWRSLEPGEPEPADGGSGAGPEAAVAPDAATGDTSSEGRDGEAADAETVADDERA